MCGIAGLFNFIGEEDELKQHGYTMLNTLLHRGPDGGGLWTSSKDGLLLGHRRLAIQDLSQHGAQPMLSNSNRYRVVFNGEIYNFKELAYDLEKLGHIFRGHSDTEVLLAAIDAWGIITALERFVGMFAFALWDDKEKTLSICRDRLGEKPLYYGLIGRTFYFASELKAIEAVINRSDLTIDKTALNSFFKYGYIDAPHSIYNNIHKLLPGTTLNIKKEDVIYSRLSTPIKYWNILSVANKGLISSREPEAVVIEKLDELLKETIRRQLIADVSVGTFLSGGIDSTLVSAIAQSQSSRNIQTFTIGYSDKEYDESVYAEKIARHIGSDHQTVYITSDDALNVIPQLPRIYDEPFADSSQIPAYLVAKIAKQHVTVCLSGDGGDELFSGYNRYSSYANLWGKISKLPIGIRKNIGKLLAFPSPRTWDHLYQILKTADSGNNYKLIGLKVQKLAGLLQQKTIYHGYDYLLSYWNRTELILKKEYWIDYTSNPKEFPQTTNFLEEAMYWDQVSYLPSDNLTKVDRASMSVSLETRLPLLSHQILEYSWAIPLSLKIKDKSNKWILRKILDRYVPADLIDRPKMGFSVPISNWLKRDLKEWAEDLLFSQSLYTKEMFDQKTIQKVWSEHLCGKYDHSHRLWALLMFLSWQSIRI